MSESTLSYTAEADAFRDALDRSRPNAVTACAGWTAHELLAHLVASGLEMATVASSALNGDPTPPTRGFTEREAPFLVLDDSAPPG